MRPGLGPFLKRVLDFVASTVGLVVLAVPFALIALAIRLGSPGPVFFRQKRVGRGGRPRRFRVWKFLTMVKDAERIGLGLNVSATDDRITRVGRFLRDWALDELPQLINVWQGDMSLVGPRPTVPAQVALYDDFERRRLEVKPGLTGWAQVHGRNAISWEERIRYDVWYVRLSVGSGVGRAGGQPLHALPGGIRVKREIGEIEKHLAAICAVLAEMRNRTVVHIPDAWIVSCARPFIEQSRWNVLACLELLLQVESPRSNRHVFARRLAESPTSGVPPDYWTRDPISEGVIDTAVQLGVLTSAEKELLLKEPAWDLPLDSLIDQLENETRCVQAILSRCSARHVEQPSVKSVTSGRPAEIEGPNPHVSEAQVRASLEARFGGSLEREIDGTLGKILIFRRPPNTYPERIAVKTVSPERVKASHRLGAIERFVHEVRHWIKYRHSPLILTPFFAALVHGWPYIAMPYCECTLRDYIDGQVPRRPQAEAVALMVQCLTALEFAAKRGLLAHQDLKPENILLQDVRKRFRVPEDYPFIWWARLADFGLANAYVELNIPWGSRPYLAPEQYEQNADLSKVDVFACGVMLHELLTGFHPIGVRTSDVWPKPRQSPQWGHEGKWKRWARSTEKLSRQTAAQLGDLRDIVEETLRTDARDRPSVHELRVELLHALKRMDNRWYENLNLLLTYFHFTSVYSAILDDDDDRYQLKYLEELTH